MKREDFFSQSIFLMAIRVMAQLISLFVVLACLPSFGLRFAKHVPKHPLSSPLPPIPGLGFAGVGFDIISGEALFPVAGLSFAQNKTWISLWGPPTVFSVPDQAKVSVNPYSGVRTYTFRSEHEYSSHLARQAGVRDQDGPFFANSEEMTIARSMMNGGAASFSETEDSFSLSRLSLVPPAQLPLTSGFSSQLAALPAQYVPSAYAQFVQTFGTHVIMDVTVGGKASWQSSSQSKYSANYTDVVLHGNAEVAYESGFKLGVGTAYNRNSSSSSYSNSSQGQVSLVGGDPTQTAFASWIVTVPLQPAPVQYLLAPITAFVQNNTIAANLKQYLVAYYSQFTLGSYKSLTQTSQWRIEHCDCQTVNYTIPQGFALRAFTADLSRWDGVYYVYNPELEVCRPCLSWSKGDDFGSLQQGLQPHPAALFPRPQLASSMLIPGLDMLGAGFDAALGEFRPLQIFQLGALNQTFQNPFTGQAYVFPSNVQFSTFGSGSRTVQSTFTSSQQYAKYLSSKFNMDANVAGFGASFDVKDSEKYFYASQAVLALHEAMTTLYSLTMPADSPLSSSFASALEALPSLYDFDAYTAFVQQYGTHVVQLASIGGTMSMKAGLDQDIYSQSSSTSIDVFFSALFKFFQDGSWSSSTTRFAQSSFASAKFLGGDFQTALLLGSYNQWVQSLWNEPVIVRASLVPFYSLAQNASLQANLKSFIAAYLKNHSSVSTTVSNLPLLTLSDNPLSSSTTAVVNNLGNYTDGAYAGPGGWAYLSTSNTNMAFELDQDWFVPNCCSCNSTNNTCECSCPEDEYVVDCQDGWPTDITAYTSGGWITIPATCNHIFVQCASISCVPPPPPPCW